ncbi:inositol monophosphatase family protein [Erythrobacter alti]|uniref:inositol monophosphatase family protein n=1 Tax=Erythrobacter alti TaxID=1896145 RepID=UPI0030F47B19
MSDDIMTLHREMESLLRDVTENAILPRFRNLSVGEIEDKGSNDPVTIADRESEAMLREGLEKLIPGLAFVGEEAAHADPSVLDRLEDDCWIVDPVDGTRNFAAGKPPFGILIAMASGGEAHTGWIYDCLSGRFCVAHRGKGAFIGEEKVTAQPTGETPPVAAISLIFMEEARREAMKAHIMPHYTLTDIPYCAAEQYPRLALGTNDVSIFERTLAWDHAAGVLWLNEAGGKAARLDGSPYRVDEWDRKGLVGAASPAMWDAMVERLNALDA